MLVGKETRFFIPGALWGSGVVEALVQKRPDNPTLRVVVCVLNLSVLFVNVSCDVRSTYDLAETILQRGYDVG